jgi:hypothetical protein
VQKSFLPLPGIELRSSSQLPVAILTELYRLILIAVIIFNEKIWERTQLKFVGLILLHPISLSSTFVIHTSRGYTALVLLQSL